MDWALVHLGIESGGRGTATGMRAGLYLLDLRRSKPLTPCHSAPTMSPLACARCGGWVDEVAPHACRIRIVCHFSCGAASAVACKLAIAQYGDVEIINAYIVEEHEDNRRFLADCERWFGQPVTVLRDEKYGASTDEVWRRERYMRGLRGASCTRALKGKLLDAFREPGDVTVIGYTAEEQDRFEDFVERHPTVTAKAPLIEAGLGKADCLAMVQRAGIELPEMYRMGYRNANCVGCIKGGKGYWNKIRVDFPERFEAVAAIEEELGPTAYLFYDEKTKKRISLRQLSPTAGRNQREPDISCSFFCETAERTMEEA